MMHGALVAAVFGIGLFHAAQASQGRCDAPGGDTNTRPAASLMQMMQEAAPKDQRARSAEEKMDHRAAAPAEVVPKPKAATGNTGTLLARATKKDAAHSVHSTSRDDFSASLRSLMSVSRDCLSVLHQARERIVNQGVEMPSNGKHVSQETAEGGTTDAEVSHVGHMAQVELERLQKTDSSATMCQTGFNFGNSAVALLCNTSAARLFSWDLGEHDYVKTAGGVVEELFPGRHTLTLGNSMQTLLPEPANRVLGGRLCDLVFVDGGHDLEVIQADIKNFAPLAAPNALFIIDDCPPKDQRGKDNWQPQAGMWTVGQAFNAAVDKGILVEDTSAVTFGSEGTLDSRSICMGRKAS